jgi:hypothetical protein
MTVLSYFIYGLIFNSYNLFQETRQHGVPVSCLCFIACFVTTLHPTRLAASLSASYFIVFLLSSGLQKVNHSPIAWVSLFLYNPISHKQCYKKSKDDDKSGNMEMRGSRWHPAILRAGRPAFPGKKFPKPKPQTSW